MFIGLSIYESPCSLVVLVKTEKNKRIPCKSSETLRQENRKVVNSKRVNGLRHVASSPSPAGGRTTKHDCRSDIGGGLGLELSRR